MTEEQIELGRRAVACKGWRWMPGMLDQWGLRYAGTHVNHTRAIPDVTDPATLGCLLALVRKVWGDLHMVARCDDRHGKVSWWICRWGDLPRSRECFTEAEALVAALEDAP